MHPTAGLHLQQPDKKICFLLSEKCTKVNSPPKYIINAYLCIEIMVDTQKNKQVNGCEQLGERYFFTSLILTLIFYYFVSIPFAVEKKKGGGGVS